MVVPIDPDRTMVRAGREAMVGGKGATGIYRAMLAAAPARLLLPREEEVIELLRKAELDGSEPPSFQDIADALGYASKSGVSKLLARMVEAGLVSYDPGRPRSLRIRGVE